MAEKPKRPLSSYMLWLNENRESIKKKNPGIKVTEIAKLGGELWRGIKDKSEWEQKAVEAKERYTEKLQEYEENGGNPVAGGKKRGGGGGGGGRGAKKPAPVKKSKKPDTDEDESGDESE